jgi:hypothetical protein
MAHEELKERLRAAGYSDEAIAAAEAEAAAVRENMDRAPAQTPRAISGEAVRMIAEAMEAAGVQFDQITIGRVAGDPTALANVTVRRGEVTTRLMVRNAIVLAKGFKHTAKEI